MDTIFARSTAPGRAGLAVVRLSGPAAWRAVDALTVGALPQPRIAALREVRDAEDLIDRGLVILFEEGRSFTGERSAELHLHGSEAIVRAVLAVLRGSPGLRDAEPGEFTRRALENDRMALAEVEGLSALLRAETEAQRRQAMRVMSGGLGATGARWRSELLRIAASLEVTVDFADEEVPERVGSDIAASLHRVVDEMRREQAGAGAAERVARGFEIAIVGAPNAGKSTLLNRLAGREAALTSEIAGTTRDVVEVRMEIGGQLVTLLDTAGIREATDVIERLGVERARQRAEEADLRIFLDAVPKDMVSALGDLIVGGKADLQGSGAGGLAVSGATGQGVDRLLEAIRAELETRVSGAGVVINERQAAALARASVALAEAADVLEADPERTEVASDLIRSAMRAVEETVGRIGIEDVLGEVFAEFCIGK